MPKLTLPFVETMITYACNLSCAGCTNYSDYNMKGYVKWATGKKWLQKWLKVINIQEFGIMGGEPTLNPECKEWLYGVRDLLPTSQLRFTSNAVNFLKKPQVLDWCIDIGNTVFKFSLHQDAPYTKESVEYVFEKYNWKPIKEHGIKRWIGPNKTRFQINTPKKFLKTYKGTFGNIKPHNNNPHEAFDICIQQNCPLLFEGKIYKCSSIALLNKVLNDWNQPITSDWVPYTSYKGISHDNELSVIKKFIDNFEKPNKICRMCPTAKDTSSVINHRKNVLTKKQWLKLNT